MDALTRRVCRTAALALVVACVGGGMPAALAAAPASTPRGAECNLRGPVKHVIYIQFDNVHFRRDNPNVPSDLQQMPHLLNFMEQGGVLLDNQHTPLIAHTATDILTSLTGLYGSHQGVPVSNSYGYFRPDGSVGFASSFGYWTDPVSTTDPHYNMMTPSGANTPAPWVPFTRAGCNVGAVGTANLELENTHTDVTTVFGAGSPQAAEAQSNPTQASADFVGISVHCARGAALCSQANGGVADVLPDEPGGYSGYSALFGAKYVDPLVSPGGPLTDLNGNVIRNGGGDAGFPGFDGMSAAVSLSWVAAMQEHGVPVTYAYISDAHDAHPSGPAYGPGATGYVAALKAYDQAFARFFQRLAADGINRSNTLFVITADEGDHFVGGAPTPAGCDGVHVPCTYSKIGEIDVNTTGLLATQAGIKTPFDIHYDSAPTFYLTGNPAPAAPVTRAFERAAGRLTAVNPLSGKTETLAKYLAGPAEMKLLHMVTGDPARTPTFTLFAKPDYYLLTGAPNCNSACVTEDPSYAWNHGDVSPDVNTTWLGLVGPGIRRLGVDAKVWSDETDIRPTLMALTGLKDDYAHDGRVLFEVMRGSALPSSVKAQPSTLIELADVYKQIDAPVGDLGLASLRISTRALDSSSPGDAEYTRIEGQLAQIATRRNALASQMESLLEAAAFHGRPVDRAQATSLIDQGRALLARVNLLARGA